MTSITTQAGRGPVWKGADAMRKRGVSADPAHLALDGSGRKAQLYVDGPFAREQRCYPRRP
ncbi:hypothetical protein HNR23_004099 [Nocardiopsis mwathae]|uniref:Uncharacterized protein n=1 Tax=Nocardiopsis mwathae TaxID=1472723 RepID=A0A7W9YKW3_9ACTN|nr:hypothetical protein [Nocardiopsis mwathae]MBB6174039.1 hypothetical protein [Nocardiopsis mwathae]